jgi:hypothetical protein
MIVIGNTGSGHLSACSRRLDGRAVVPFSVLGAPRL